MQRLPCKACGESIHPDTAAKNDGLCMPCKRGYRQQLEDSKRWRAEWRNFEEEYDRSEEARFWHRLNTVVDTEGFNKLPAHEQTYYALSILIGEVHNGGLHQFFFNSSGATYGVAADGLLQVGAYDVASLLSRAKALLFGASRVPTDTGRRREVLAERGFPPELEELDRAFWNSEARLQALCRKFASEQRLWPGA